MALDPRDSPYFRNNPAFAGFNHSFSGTNAASARYLSSPRFTPWGLVRKDSYATHTSLLAAEAAADAEIMAWVLKNATGRERPGAVPAGGNYSDTWFEHYQPPLLGEEGFPSGHAIAAFSVATVFARRYRNHRWVPWVAYGAASTVGFSRISLQAHFPSDVFAGAVFGYAISRFVVLRARNPSANFPRMLMGRRSEMERPCPPENRKAVRSAGILPAVSGASRSRQRAGRPRYENSPSQYSTILSSASHLVPGQVDGDGELILDRDGEERRRGDLEVRHLCRNRTGDLALVAFHDPLKGNLLVLDGLAGELDFDVKIERGGFGSGFGHARAHGHEGEFRAARHLQHVKVEVAIARIE